MTLKHHRNDDGSHQIEIDALRILLFQEGEHWIAQGLDLDYAAAGTSIKDVKKRFATGLCYSLSEHLKKHNSLEAFLRPAPNNVWQLYYRQVRLESVETLPAADCHRETPFRQLAFLQPATA